MQGVKRLAIVSFFAAQAPRVFPKCEAATDAVWARCPALFGVGLAGQAKAGKRCRVWGFRLYLLALRKRLLVVL